MEPKQVTVNKKSTYNNIPKSMPSTVDFKNETQPAIDFP